MSLLACLVEVFMISKSTLAAAAVAAMVAVAAPAFAQNLETGTAANRAQLYDHGPAPRGLVPYDWHAERGGGLGAYAMVPPSPGARQHRVVPYGRRSDRASGLNAYGMVPGGARGPAATGGGSIGYNRSLLHDD